MGREFQIIVGIATFKGRELTLEKTIKSLINQVDDIHVYNNEKEDVNLTDNGKFAALRLYSKPVYFFTCDDDLIYPSDYVQKSIEAIEQHNCIVSYHGRILRGVGLDYYRGHTGFRCLDNYPQTKVIDVPGTGVTAFRTDYFNPVGIHNATDKRMSDLVFALEAAKQGKTITHIGHEGKWIRQQELPIEQTIYGMENKRAFRQQEIANEIWYIKNKS